jgi:hypothetical protein
VVLPDPRLVRTLKAKDFHHGLRELYTGLSEVLTAERGSDLACNAENSVDEPGDLDSSPAIHQNTGLKRRAAA